MSIFSELRNIASRILNDSSVAGASVKDALNTLYAAVTSFTTVNVPTRQTVLSGPQVLSGAAWVPNFLAATYASLVVTTQNVGAGVNQLIATASNGDSDLKAKSSTNIVWPACTANATNYLFCDVSGGVLTPVAPTTLPPIEQDGGTPSIVNGQYTYNIKEHTQYLGNGTSAVQVNHVKFAEVVAGVSGISSTVAYAYEGRYDSGYTATLPAAATAISKNSNIGVEQVEAHFIRECTTIDIGYAVGDDVIDGTVGMTTSGVNYFAPIPVVTTRNTVGFTTGNTTSMMGIHKTSGVIANLTLASWKYKMIAQRSWN